MGRGNGSGGLASLRTKAGRCAAGHSPKLEATAPLPPRSFQLPQAGSLAAWDRATGHLRGEDERAAGGNLARDSAAPRGLSSRDSAGSGPSRCCASSSDSTLKGSGPGPARSPPHVLSLEEFMTSDAGAMRTPAGAGLAGPGRRVAGAARPATARDSERPRPPYPIKRRCPFHEPLSNRLGRCRVAQASIGFADPGGGKDREGRGRRLAPARPSRAERSPPGAPLALSLRLPPSPGALRARPTLLLSTRLLRLPGSTRSRPSRPTPKSGQRARRGEVVVGAPALDRAQTLRSEELGARRLLPRRLSVARRLFLPLHPNPTLEPSARACFGPRALSSPWGPI